MSKKNSCYNCGSKDIEESVELIIAKGKSIPQKINRCSKCGEATVSINDYEKTRKQLHPSLLTRIRNFFKSDTKFVEIMKGKVL